MTLTPTEFLDQSARRTERVKRDHLGRYRIPDPTTSEERSYSRATTIAQTLSDKFGLQDWRLRMSALGLVQRPDLYALVAACDPGDKRALNELVGQAAEAAASSRGANIGTALHGFTERVDRGETVQVPEPWDADVAVYLETMSAHGVTIVPGMIEKTVVLQELGVAGTFDRLVTVGPSSEEGEYDEAPLIADLKTGSFLDWTEIAIQLALYAHASSIYDHDTRTHQPMPEVDQDTALVMHLPAGKATCTLYLVDIAAGWAAVQRALWVREWRKRKDLVTALPRVASVVEAPVEPHAPFKPAECVAVAERRASLETRIATMREQYPDALATLGRLWPQSVAPFKTQATHTSDELDLAERAISRAEAEHDIPFGPNLDQPEPPRQSEAGATPPAPLGLVDLFAPVAAPGVSPDAPRPSPVDSESRGARSPDDATPPVYSLAGGVGGSALRERIEAIAARWRALPVDLRDDVDDRKNAANLPNLAGLRVLPEHVDAAERIVEAAEGEWRARRDTVDSWVGTYDDEMVDTAIDYAGGTQRNMLTLAQLATTHALLEALDSGDLAMAYDDKGTLLVLSGKGAAALDRRYGTKSALLTAAKTMAGRLGRAKPRSAASACADVVLAVALLADT